MPKTEKYFQKPIDKLNFWVYNKSIPPKKGILRLSDELRKGRWNKTINFQSAHIALKGAFYGSNKKGGT